MTNLKRWKFEAELKKEMYVQIKMGHHFCNVNGMIFDPKINIGGSNLNNNTQAVWHREHFNNNAAFKKSIQPKKININVCNILLCKLFRQCCLLNSIRSERDQVFHLLNAFYANANYIFVAFNFKINNINALDFAWIFHELNIEYDICVHAFYISSMVLKISTRGSEPFIYKNLMPSTTS